MPPDPQPTLFAEPEPQGPARATRGRKEAAAEQGAARDVAFYASVAVPLPVRGVFDYAVPPSLAGDVIPGVRVAVRFHGQRVVAHVVSVSAQPSPGLAAARILPVLGVVEARPIFTPELLRFLREAADYYLHPLGEVLRTASPAVDSRTRAALEETLEGAGSNGGGLRARWAQVRTETFVRRLSAGAEAPSRRLGERQTAVLALLESRDEVPLTELRGSVPTALDVVRSLAARGLVETRTQEVPVDRFFGAPVARDVPPALTEPQAAAAARISQALRDGERAVFLLHGVTGSGKTEVYLRAVEEAQRLGKGTLLLLPEIALTPQLVGRYRARFGDDLAVLHSGLGDAERFAMWRRLRSGACKVAIGARSALFAPVEDLGLVLVDEEHDPSFKQEEGFRYHGRDLAVLRAHRAGAVCVLGSATPSVETYQAALDGRYRYLELPARATKAPMPRIDIVDLRRIGAQLRKGPAGHELLSPELLRGIEETLRKGEQTILFLNRRGFAPSIRCETCAAVVSCPSCSVALVLHRRARQLRCHYCDHAIPFDDTCPGCHGPDLHLVGAGTEKIEQALVNAFPQARVGRLDRDTASGGAGAEAVLEKMRAGEIDVLVGTQMVTKGHDLPRVTLVGVLLADAAISLPDFRAFERTYQLLSQVAGRAGRADRPGRVLVQAYDPEHPILRRARAHDYAGFHMDEVAHRKPLGYPPFGRLALVRCDAVDEAAARRVAARLSAWAASHPAVARGEVRVTDAQSSPLERLRGRYRMQFMVRSPERGLLRQVLVAMLARADAEPPRTREERDVRTIVDVDPVQML